MKKIYLSLLTFIMACASTSLLGQTQVTFYTTLGNFEVEMYESFMPITAGNFIDLVQDEFYDGIIFHRVIEGFVIQGGDPLGTGFGGPGYTILDEFSPYASNVQMALGMANSGPNSGGSQFFINLVDNTYLDPDYPVFGIVTSNFSVVETIGSVATNIFDKPTTDVVMDSVRVSFNPYASIENANLNALAFEVSPNPISNESRITIEAKQNTAITIYVYNQMGQQALVIDQFLNSGINVISTNQLGFQLLANGIYYLNITDGLLQNNQKIVLARQ